MKKLIQSYIDNNLMSDHHAKDVIDFAETNTSKIKIMLFYISSI